MASEIAQTIHLLGRILKDARIYCVVGDRLSLECGVPHFRDILHGVWSGPPNRVDPFHSAVHARIVRGWLGWRRALVRQQSEAVPYRVLAMLQEGMGLEIGSQCADGLAGFNGVRRVSELYGNVFAARCAKCGRGWPADLDGSPPVECPDCGGAVWPDVAMFGWNGRAADAREWAGRIDGHAVLLRIGDDTRLAPRSCMPGAEVHVTPQFIVITEAGRVHLLPIKTLAQEMERQPWPANLPKLPSETGLRRSLVCLLWLVFLRNRGPVL